MYQPASILHIGKFYPPHPGGMETHLKGLVSWQSRYAQVEVMVSSTGRRTCTELLDGARITRLATFGSIASMPVTPAFFWKLRGRHDDILHMHMPNPSAAAAYLFSGHPGRLILTHHGDTTGRRALRRLSDPFVRHAMKRADAILVSSQRYIESSEELQGFRDKCCVVPLGIDLSAHANPDASAVAEIRARYGPRFILAIGRLVPYKGFDYLIRALRATDATLVLIGEGPMLKELQATAQSAGVASRVHFTGYVRNLTPYFAAAMLFALPSISRAESFGLVQVEAMAAGLPVINTMLPSAVPEVSLQGVTGFTVEPMDEKALASAIQMLLENDRLRKQFGHAARARARLFSLENTAQQVSAIYEQVISHPDTDQRMNA